MVTTWILWRELFRIRNDIRRLAEETRISTGGKGPAVVREIYHQLRRIGHLQRELAQVGADEDLSLRAILGRMSESGLVANADLPVRLVNDQLQRMCSFSRVSVRRKPLQL